MPLIVTPVSVTNVGSPTGIVVATVTGVFPGQAVATLTSDQLTGGALEVVYDAAVVATAIANWQAGLLNLDVQNTNLANAGIILSSAQIAQIRAQVDALLSSVVGQVIYHPGVIAVSAVDGSIHCRRYCRSHFCSGAQRADCSAGGAHRETAINAVPSSPGTLSVGERVTFTLNINTTVQVVGDPTLLLSNGATATFDAAA